MKITGVRTLVVNAQMRNWVFVRIDTDQPGLYGWGEATLEWKTRAVVGAVQDLEPLVLGRDPRDIEQLLRIMNKHGFWRIGVIGKTAMSGIEVALWDIFGKCVGLPVWRRSAEDARPCPSLHASRHGRNDRRLRDERHKGVGRSRTGGQGEGLYSGKDRHHSLYPLHRFAARDRCRRQFDGSVARGAGGRD